MNEILLVICNVPDHEVARRLATMAIESHLAACVNIQATCESIYRWQGNIESAAEVPLLIKTTRAAFPALEAMIRENRPYEIPEIIAIPVSEGLPAYLDWIRAEINH